MRWPRWSLKRKALALLAVLLLSVPEVIGVQHALAPRRGAAAGWLAAAGFELVYLSTAILSLTPELRSYAQRVALAAVGTAIVLKAIADYSQRVPDGLLNATQFWAKLDGLALGLSLVEEPAARGPGLRHGHAAASHLGAGAGRCAEHGRRCAAPAAARRGHRRSCAGPWPGCAAPRSSLRGFRRRSAQPDPLLAQYQAEAAQLRDQLAQPDPQVAQQESKRLRSSSSRLRRPSRPLRSRRVNRPIGCAGRSRRSRSSNKRLRSCSTLARSIVRRLRGGCAAAAPAGATQLICCAFLSRRCATG